MASLGHNELNYQYIIDNLKMFCCFYQETEGEEEKHSAEDDKSAEETPQAAENAGKTEHDSTSVEPSEGAQDSAAQNENETEEVWMASRPCFNDKKDHLSRYRDSHCKNKMVVSPSRWVSARRNSNALAMELHLSCTNPSILSL